MRIYYICFVLIFSTTSLEAQDSHSLKTKQSSLSFLNNTLRELSHKSERERKLRGRILIGIGAWSFIPGIDLISTSGEKEGPGEIIGGAIILLGGFSIFKGVGLLSNKSESEKLFIKFKVLPEVFQSDIELKIDTGQKKFKELSIREGNSRRKAAIIKVAAGVGLIAITSEGGLVGTPLILLGATQYFGKSLVEKEFDRYKRGR